MSAPLLSLGRDRLTFHFEGHEASADRTRLLLRYSVRSDDGREEFVERVELPGRTVESLDEDAFDRVLRLLWLAGGMSYYKAFAPRRVVVPVALTPLEREFLESMFRGGLAEYAYRNDLPEALEPDVEAAPRTSYGGSGPTTADVVRHALVPVGGGKDSVDTIETLRGAVDALTLFSVNDFAPIRATAETAGLPLVQARRALDPHLLELNAQGALNGHVPVTAVNSTIGTLTAMLLGADAVVFSNERSASSGNLLWHGQDVNHQWSKSLEFERLLREALADAGCPVAYFSLLRPVSELAIVRRFAGLREYHRVITSCNRAFRLNPAEGASSGWCGDCPKCQFVHLMLAPHLSPDELAGIFGRDLFADPRQTEGFAELVGVTGHKPFECVGEVEECQVAWHLVRESPEWKDHPFVVDNFGGRLTSAPSDEQVADGFAFGGEHFLPDHLVEVVRAAH